MSASFASESWREEEWLKQPPASSGLRLFMVTALDADFPQTNANNEK